MDIKDFSIDGNIRELENGTLIRMVKHAQPVVFERIDPKTSRHAADTAVFVYLDPIEGLKRIRYGVSDEYDSVELFRGSNVNDIDQESEEGKKYLRLITGK